ncbi:arsenate reductase ArsC [Fructobacillus americanaquae]|uniref:Arsenate reductase ArsC n=1 Tax=Fructobacillus americanaquae TaxID=2940302 RepID=A0ABY5BYH7_9LACO|nr:arsenate reductase ArsC [Fructobacillus americanaquae]USS91579.1 arsenate reductase ArsC [Fructobacillus americanaquae]
MQLYFLCTGNSSRSQFAEVYARYYAPTDWSIKSAGTNPRGVHPQTIMVLNQEGFDTTHLTSDSIDDNFFNSSDYIVTLCGDARDNCPITTDSVQTIHFPLADPARVTGSDEEITDFFQKTATEIKHLMQTFITDIQKNA